MSTPALGAGWERIGWVRTAAEKAFILGRTTAIASHGARLWCNVESEEPAPWTL